MREKILKAGIKHLREFGYPNVNAKNIITDLVYRAFFKRMLEGTIEDVGTTSTGSIVKECRKLIAEIEAAGLRKEG